MAVSERIYTAEEFWQITQLPENELRRLELDEGVIVDMGSSSQENTVVAGRMIYFLNAHVIPNDLGYVTAPDGGFQLALNTVRQPDAAFITKARHASLSGGQFPVAPDLAVEVVSPHEDPLKKVNEYINAGVRLVWVIYPTDRTVYAFRPPESGELRARILRDGDVLDGADVLPDFRLPVSDIFPA